jgi:beta-ureidopropionase / N-carbamoyl-L-amino-acid hydrolase
VITADDIEARLAGLDAVGATDAGFHRLAWTDEDRAAAAWFAEQGARLGLRVERDGAGNLWAVPDVQPPWWGVGSHLDTVAGGGRYDGALGVACAFAIAAAIDRAVAVVSFADEEGARYNTPTFGSRALVGRLDVDDVLARADASGVTMADAMQRFGVDPAGLRAAPVALERLRGFLEIHIDQSRALEEAGRPIGVVSALAGRMRVAVEIDGEADHAGTTRRSERRDALAAAARLIVGAEDLAAPNPDFVVTPTRILVEPNALSTIPGAVRLWLDARAPRIEDVDAWRTAVDAAATRIAAERRVDIRLATASRSAGVEFDAAVRVALVADGAPELVCFAGHDAGVIGERRPAGMLLVRNPTGVSHSPGEEVSVADAAVAANAVAAALEELS